jgi:tripartite-type tricarboxylate transporter receptor subunit TctC
MKVLRACVLAGLTLLAPQAMAQAYPTKAVRAIVPVPAGGYYDNVTRIVTQKLGERLGQGFIVENRVGAGSMTGTAFVAAQAPDGYTLLFNGTGGLSIFPSLYAKLPYDPVRDFTPVIHVAGVPNIVVVNPSLPAKSIKELIAIARSKPGAIAYASNGNGTTQHLSTEMFGVATGTKFMHVPYNGSAPAVTSIMGGQTQVLFGVATDVMQQIRAGKLRALAVATPKRMSVLSDVPTLAEAGVPGIEVEIWMGMFAPRNTPRDIVMRLNTETNRVLEMPDVRERIAPGGIGEAKGGTPEQMAALLQSELAKWAKAVKESGAKAE